MEALKMPRPATAGLLSLVCLTAGLAQGAEFRTTNFVVTAPTEEMARQIAETAEISRRDLAMEWLGATLPNWYRPCPVNATVGAMGAGGATTFTFDRGEVSGWNMRVQGSLERILDSVIPHEVSHTVFASYFRRPLPRWADEGAATLIEHPDERKRQEVLLERVISTPRRIPLDKLLTMTDYPTEMQQVYTLYAEGYSLSNYLVMHRGDDGKAVFLAFLQDAHERGWNNALRKHYGIQSIAELEKSWTGWVIAGSPPPRRSGEQLASADTARSNDTNVAAGPAQTAATAITEMAALPVAPEQMLAAMTSLQPLPRLERPRRAAAESDDLNAPAPGAGRDARAAAGRPGSVGALAQAGGRVVPRVDPTPGFEHPASIRWQQTVNESVAAARQAQEVSTARTGQPSASTLRGQSPESAHWSQFTGFPGVSEGRVPFSR